MGDPSWKSTSPISETDPSGGVGASNSSGVSDPVRRDSVGEKGDKSGSVGEGPELPVSDKAGPVVDGDEPSLFAQEFDEPDGLGSLLNEKRKGRTAAGSFSCMRSVIRLCSYTQSDPSLSLAHGVQGYPPPHLCVSPSRQNKRQSSDSRGRGLTRFLLLMCRAHRSAGRLISGYTSSLNKFRLDPHRHR